MSHEVKIHGFVSTPDQFMSGGMEMFTVTVAEDIKTKDAKGLNAKLDVLVETVSMKAQPVVMGEVKGSGPYTLTFAVEHKDSIVPAALVAALKATGEFADPVVEAFVL